MDPGPAAVRCQPSNGEQCQHLLRRENPVRIREHRNNWRSLWPSREQEQRVRDRGPGWASN